MGVVTDYQGRTIGWRGPDGKIYKTNQDYEAQRDANKTKTNHSNLKNDRGLGLGDGQGIDLKGGARGVRVPGGASNVTAGGTLNGSAPIQVGGQALFPLVQGEDAVYVPKGYSGGIPSGTNTGSGERDAPSTGSKTTENKGWQSMTPEEETQVLSSLQAPPTPRDRMADASEYDRMAAWAKANPTLAAKVKPGQAGYEEIQQYLNPVTDSTIQDFKDDSGHSLDESEAILRGGSVESVIDSSGISTTITTPQTTSNPASPQDGTSGVPDVFDQSRSLSIPGIDPQEFLSKKVKSVGDILAGETNPDRFIFKD